MQMTEKVIAFGSLAIMLVAALVVAVFPAVHMKIPPSDIARPYKTLEAEGRRVYISYGCTYCHSQYIRPQDWGHGAVRVAQPGDYIYDRPHLLGSERTGPDLSEEGGLRSDDWHLAHLMNPRYTRPASLMPQFGYLSTHERDALIAYLQGLGGKGADARLARLMKWRTALKTAYARGTDANFAYLHTLVPPQWRTMPNPYGPTPEALARGRFVYRQQCIGCHGEFGDGKGPAAQFLNPKPANFTALRRIGASGGLLYYQIMNGITGTAMMSFKRDLESEKIWDVSNYIATQFIGRDDGNTAPHGEPEIQEPVDPNAALPPDPNKISVPPPTSADLQGEVNAIRKRTPGTSNPPPAAPRKGAR